MKIKIIFHLICCAGPLLFAFMLCSSCYSYNVRMVMRARPSPSGGQPFDSDIISESSLYSWKRSAPAPEPVVVRKYYAVMRERGPLAEMNNMAVSLAAGERYFEAEIILKQALEEIESEPALHNNLGVVYEMTGRAVPASQQYLRACILDDGNWRMRSNFLSLHELPGK